MGSIGLDCVKMKVLVLFTFLFSTSLAFEFNLNPKSESDRGLCCLFFNAQSDCATRCSGRSCTDRCNVNCGVANTLCGSWACTTETTTVAATTTAAASTCSATSTCTDGTTGCSSGTVCYDGTNVVNGGCCGQTANYCLVQ